MADQIAPAEAPKPVTIKPEAIEPGKPAKDENSSDLPYHTKQTEDIAKSRKPEEAGPYKYEANGYTVTEEKLKGDRQFLGAVDGKVYKVVADGGFQKVYTSKANAELYANTHAAGHKDLPATVSKA